MEMYRSGHNENDSKSFWRDERHVGSNPTISAKNFASSRILRLLALLFYLVVNFELLSIAAAEISF